MRLCSFGRSLLVPSFRVRPVSVRLAFRAFVAARRRWPLGRLSVGVSTLRWLDVDGCCGLLLEWELPRWLPRPGLFVRAVRDAHSDVLAGPVSWSGAAWFVVRNWRSVRAIYC